jgi:LuxR family transcriptional regulator, maltose regulon positive regulatory protein
MDESAVFHDQLLATKFFTPSSSHALIPRPRLIELLNMSLKCPLTLVSAPAGFGKTTLLSTWVQSLPPERPRIAWVSPESTL